MGLLAKAPRVEIPRIKGWSVARARAVTMEEYERMLAVVPKVRPKDADQWLRLLRVAWLSGLRLRELLSLSWDTDAALSVDVSYKRPVLRIRGDGQKSGRDETIPLAPDFGQWLMATPEQQRVGLVCPVVNYLGKPMRPGEVGKVVSAIGRKAGVVTNKAAGRFATLHDLRRGFASVWARKVSPSVLRRLMRHKSVATTEAYYIELDAAALSDELWAKHSPAHRDKPQEGNNPGNIRPQEAPTDVAQN